MNQIVDNLLSAPVLFFVLGCLAAAIKTDLKLPKAFGQILAIYIMAAIGFKGGVELNKNGIDGQALTAVAVGLLLAFITPLIAFAINRYLNKFNRLDAATIAAHYGSVSLITFGVAIAFYQEVGQPASGYMAAVLALMELPALAVGIALANNNSQGVKGGLRHALTSGTILILIGSLIIGLILGSEGAADLEGFFVTPFIGAVAFFLFDMGLSAFRNIDKLKEAGLKLIAFAIYMPLIGATLGLLLASVADLSVGDSALLATLAASASYIAAPAAIRVAVPEANIGMVLPVTILITFPFNLIIGLPLYLEAAKLLS